MKDNNTVDTAQKGQTANKIQSEKVQNAKKDKTPTGKVTVISEKSLNERLVRNSIAISA